MRWFRLNYISEINAFFEWTRENKISHSVVNLWITLMHINNRLMWREWIEVSTTELCNLTKLSESSITRTRKEMEQLGLILFHAKRGNPTRYKIISFESRLGNNIRHSDGSSVDKFRHGDGMKNKNRHGDGTFRHSDGYHIQLDDDDDIDKTSVINFELGKVMKYWPESFGELNKTKINLVEQILNDFDKELVEEAFKKAELNDAKSINYVKVILDNWLTNGIKTKVDLKKQEMKSKKFKSKPVINKSKKKIFEQKYTDISNDELEKRFIKNI